MSTLYFETDATEPCPIGFAGPTDMLVYFLSLAFSTRYGAQHDLARLALILRGVHKIDLDPLTTFADRDVEVEADVDAIVAGAPGLRERLVDLQRMAEWAVAREARVRLSFDL